MKNRQGKKKGIFFSLDGIIAFSIMFVGLVLISNSYIGERPIGSQIHLTEDVAGVLGELKVSEVDNTYIQGLIGNGTIKGAALNNSLIEMMAQFWAENQTALANGMVQSLGPQLFPDMIANQQDIQFIVGDDIIYETNGTSKTIVIPMKRIVTGIAKDKVTRGIIARAYLTSIKGKATSRYMYYGGFVGQGNITKFLDNIPADANITQIYLEVDVGKNFTFFINDVQCGGLYISSGIKMSADGYDLSSCNDSIILEENVKNNFTIKFPIDSIDNRSFIGGGFLRVSYLTNELLDIEDDNITTYWFPQIEGVVNLYTAVAVPGTIVGMDAYLHYNASNKTSHFLFGNSVVHEHAGDPFAEQEHYLNNTFLQNRLDYDYLSNNTVPLRLYFFNITPLIIMMGNADVVLITDFSVSMKKAVTGWDDVGNMRSAGDCEGDVYTDPQARKQEIALCVDQEVVNIIMNTSISQAPGEIVANRIYPVHFHDNDMYNYTSTTKADLIDYYQNEFPPQGKRKTCLGCSLNRAYDILEEVSSGSRSKYVIMMTDGMPSHCPDDGCEAGNSSLYAGVEECPGLCDVPSCTPAIVVSDCADCTLNNGAINNTLYTAQRLVDNLNVTIYTVGFGPMDECPAARDVLREVATISNGTYNHSNNLTVLVDIYRDIASDILLRTNLTSQAVVIDSNVSQVSTLFGDSYLRINFTPAPMIAVHGVISLTLEQSNFTSECTGNVYIEEEMRVLMAGLTSYSSEHWTDGLTVNNQVVFNLSDYSTEYSELGDPYYINIPPGTLNIGTNILELKTGDNPKNNTGCSTNNTFIYTVEINLTIPYTGVSEKADGCTWDLEYEDGTFDSLDIPIDPAPTESCNYTSTSIDYDETDAYQLSAYSLFSQLDFDDDGKVNIEFDELDLTIDSAMVEEVPSLWGPTIAEVKTWQ